MDLKSRRYIGCKTKLLDWINDIIQSECKNCNSFLDLFAGTGVVAQSQIGNYKTIILNDFLFSNQVIYKAFFGIENCNMQKLQGIIDTYNGLDKSILEDNYVSHNYGNKYFSYDDAKLIGYVREDIEKLRFENRITEKEFYVLLGSLLYSFDKIANTVGHYESYRRVEFVASKLVLDLITPIDLKSSDILIYREDANHLVKDIKSDIVFIDPPYNKRQYSRYYHVLETIVKWDKPTLKGVTAKPPLENMSKYSVVAATDSMKDLIFNIDSKYIVLTYNNTTKVNSKNAPNLIDLEALKDILETKGNVKIFEHTHKPFNAGKTNFTEDHKEYLFIVEVKH